MKVDLLQYFELGHDHRLSEQMKPRFLTHPVNSETKQEPEFRLITNRSEVNNDSKIMSIHRYSLNSLTLH